MCQWRFLDIFEQKKSKIIFSIVLESGYFCIRTNANVIGAGTNNID